MKSYAFTLLGSNSNEVVTDKETHGDENTYLRVQMFSHKTFRFFHVYCNFTLGYMCQITVIFGTLNEGSLSKWRQHFVKNR